MGNAKRHPCVKCGAIHMRTVDVCWSCDGSIKKKASSECKVCGNSYLLAGVRSHSPYCSASCATAVAHARAKVINAVNKAVKQGALKRPSELQCVDCGAKAREYDHRRYMQPLNVVPVCRPCNLKRGAAEDVHELVKSHQEAAQ